MRRLLIASLAAALLSGCVQADHVIANDGRSYPAAPVRIVAPAVGASTNGRAIPTPRQAAKIYNTACIDALPSFEATPAALGKLGLRRDPATGVFQHPSLDLSVALVLSGKTVVCSIIFATNLDPKSTADQVASYGVKKHKSFFIRELGHTANRVYLNAQIAAD